jgi:hypothetical protein
MPVEHGSIRAAPADQAANNSGTNGRVAAHTQRLAHATPDGRACCVAGAELSELRLTLV